MSYLLTDEEVLWATTVGDAEAILGRKLVPGEASSLRKTLEAGLGEEVSGLILEHFDDRRPGEPFEAEADGMGESRLPRFGGKR